MKTSSMQADKAASGYADHPEHPLLPYQVKTGLRNFLGLFSQMGSAIALGEKGDLEGAKKLREKYSKQ